MIFFIIQIRTLQDKIIHSLYLNFYFSIYRLYMGCTQAKPSSHAKQNQTHVKVGQVSKQSNAVNQDKNSQKLQGKNNQNSVNANKSNQLPKIYEQNKSDLQSGENSNSKLSNPQINVHNPHSVNKSQLESSYKDESGLESKSKSKLQSKALESAQLQIQSLKNDKKQLQNASSSKYKIQEQISEVSIQKSKIKQSQLSNLSSKVQNKNCQQQRRQNKNNNQQQENLDKSKQMMNQTAFVNNKTAKPNQRMIQSTGKIFVKQEEKRLTNKKIVQAVETSKEETFSTQVKKQKHSLGATNIHEEESGDQIYKKQKFQSVVEEPKNFEDRFNQNKKRKNSLNQIQLSNNQKQNHQNKHQEQPSEKLQAQQGNINKISDSSVPNRQNKKSDQTYQQDLSNSKYMKEMQKKMIVEVSQDKYSSNHHNNPSHRRHTKNQSQRQSENQLQQIMQKSQNKTPSKPEQKVNIILFESLHSEQSKKTVSKFNNKIGNSNEKASKQYSNLSINQSRFAKQKLVDFQVSSDNVHDQQECNYNMGMSKVKIQVQI